VAIGSCRSMLPTCKNVADRQWRCLHTLRPSGGYNGVPASLT
jgi:hypothetical protein